MAYIISEQYEAITHELLQLDRGVYDPGPFSCFSFVGGKSV